MVQKVPVGNRVSRQLQQIDNLNESHDEEIDGLGTLQ